MNSQSRCSYPPGGHAAEERTRSRAFAQSRICAMIARGPGARRTRTGAAAQPLGCPAAQMRNRAPARPLKTLPRRGTAAHVRICAAAQVRVRPRAPERMCTSEGRWSQ
jgi:hypothetical protein